MRASFKILIFLLVFSNLFLGCKKAFFPSEISSISTKYLVIEGVINGNNDSTIIKISRTQKIDTVPVVNKETQAIVIIENDGNSSFNLIETQPGIYKSPPKSLDNSKKYRLRIKTSDNKEYLSDFVAVKDSPPIDSVGFNPKLEGVQVYTNSHDVSNKTLFYRWDYAETWQFHAFYRSSYDNNLNARNANEQVYDCFGNDTSNVITIANTTKLISDKIFQAPIVLIPANSEKIETKYSIIVKQYALTSDAYAFWLNLQNNTEKLGSIFDVLPSENLSNYHCISNPTELVVGYLSVGNTASKRIFINSSELLASYSPLYPAVCEIDTAFQVDHIKSEKNQPESILTTPNSPFVPIMGLYIPPPNYISGGPTAYSYSTKLCGDCSIRGTTKQPLFWK